MDHRKVKYFNLKSCNSGKAGWARRLSRRTDHFGSPPALFQPTPRPPCHGHNGKIIPMNSLMIPAVEHVTCRRLYYYVKQKSLEVNLLWSLVVLFIAAWRPTEKEVLLAPRSVTSVDRTKSPTAQTKSRIRGRCVPRMLSTVNTVDGFTVTVKSGV